MSLGRRKVSLLDPRGWVFNRMAEAYAARPPYPPALLDRLHTLALPAGRVADIGAGIGHTAIPLSQRGCDVTAIEPAVAMLERLEAQARQQGLSIRALHATAEAVPAADRSFDLVVIADALHFLDRERAGIEVGRLLRAGGALAIVVCELARTPFMRAVVRVMEEAAPRRPRSVEGARDQLAALAAVELSREERFIDHTPVDAVQLESILRSISFIGPAMNRERFAAFRARIHAIEGQPVWSREFVLHYGFRR